MSLTPLNDPPIREAVLEFIVEPAISLSEEVLPEILNILGPNYSEDRREFIVNFTFKFDPSTESQNSTEAVRNPLGAVLYKNESESFIVQVREDRIVISKMKPYQNYDDFTNEAFRVAKGLTELFDILQFRQIGLRYINFIEQSSIDRAYFYTGVPFVQMKSNLTLRQQVTRNQYEKKDTGYSAVSQIVTPVIDPDGKGYTVIDVNCSHNGLVEANNVSDIAIIVSHLREMKNELFFSNVTGQFVRERMEDTQ